MSSSAHSPLTTRLVRTMHLTLRWRFPPFSKEQEEIAARRTSSFLGNRNRRDILHIALNDRPRPRPGCIDSPESRRTPARSIVLFRVAPLLSLHYSTIDRVSLPFKYADRHAFFVLCLGTKVVQYFVSSHLKYASDTNDYLSLYIILDYN